jgi:hypothetical protein
MSLLYLIEKTAVNLFDARLYGYEVWNPAGADYVSMLTVLIPPPYHMTGVYMVRTVSPLYTLAGIAGLHKLGPMP